jgi:Lon-like protease
VLARLLTPLRLASAGLLVLLVALLILLTRSSDHYLEIPDEAHPLATLVKVPGPKEKNDGGGIYYVDVLLKKASLLESLVPPVRPDGSDLIDSNQIDEPGISEQQRFKLELADMKISQVIASAVALRELGYKVPVSAGGLRVAAVTSDSHANGLITTGDVIVAANGKPVRTRDDLRVVLAWLKPGDVVKLGIRRGKVVRTLSVRTTSDETDPKRPIIGVLPSQALKVNFPFPISFDLGDVGGPSAGLAFALELMEKLGRDVDRGYKVAATGELSLDGAVEPIGGVRQKIVGARQADVDIFLVPAGDNATEARRYAGKVKVIPVQSFRQALAALATLPPRA